MTTELLKRVEVWIESLTGLHTDVRQEQGEILAAIRDALAEPVKQDPVAVISESAIGLVKLHSNGACLPFGTQLYAAPVSANREWVDLTLQELQACCGGELSHGVSVHAAIAAFKEKNR